MANCFHVGGWENTRKGRLKDTKKQLTSLREASQGHCLATAQLFRKYTVTGVVKKINLLETRLVEIRFRGVL